MEMHKNINMKNELLKGNQEFLNLIGYVGIVTARILLKEMNATDAHNLNQRIVY